MPTPMPAASSRLATESRSSTSTANTCHTGSLPGGGATTRAPDGSDTATSDAYFIFLIETDVAPRMMNNGHYHDTWVRTPTGWRVKVRDIVLG